MLTPFLALMAMIGIAVTALALSYPIAWVIDHTATPVVLWVWRKRRELDSAYRD